MKILIIVAALSVLLFSACSKPHRKTVSERITRVDVRDSIK